VLLLQLFLGLLFFVGVLLFAGGSVATVGLGVNGLTDLHGRVLQFLKGLPDLVCILSNNGLVQGRDVTADLLFDGVGKLFRVLLQLLLGVVDVGVSLILEVDDSLSSLVSFFGGFGLVNHAVDVGIAESTT